MDSIAQGVTKSQTQLSDFHSLYFRGLTSYEPKTRCRNGITNPFVFLVPGAASLGLCAGSCMCIWLAQPVEIPPSLTQSPGKSQSSFYFIIIISVLEDCFPLLVFSVL